MPQTGILLDWPANGPPVRWHVELGSGYGGAVVSDGRLFIFDRTGDEARLRCLDSVTGSQQWQFTYPTDYRDLYGYDNGPRCCPVVDGDRVYLFDAAGILHCVRATNGEPLWKTDTMQQFGVVQNFFGVSSAPVVEGDLLIVQIGGSPAQVMGFPGSTPDEGYVMTHGIAPNGGGVLVNNYTLIMDLMYPLTSDGEWRAIWEADILNFFATGADVFVGPNNGLGIDGVYDGTIFPDTWYRIALAFDLGTSTLNKYIDGVLVGSQTLASGTDGRWALDPTAFLFNDDTGETAPGFVNSIQIHDGTLCADTIAALGGATAAGLPVSGLPDLPGDFCLNGQVDGADFLKWQRDPSVGSLADWEANYGMVATLSASSASIPEPTTSALALAALCLAMSRRRSF